MTKGNIMKDFKHYGQDIKHSALVAQATKVNKRTTIAVSLLGGLIGALSVYLIVVVMFEGAL